MTSAREVMTADLQVLGEKDTAMTAARRMAEQGIGSLPVCGTDERLIGVVTDRDSLEEARRTMAEHQVRRLPVIDGHRLVGIISMADLARDSPESATGRTERAVTE